MPRIPALLALLAVPLGVLCADQPLGLKGMSFVSGPSQDPGALASSAENPLRVFPGQDIVVKLEGSEVRAGDMLALVSPSRSDCGPCLDSLGDVDTVEGIATAAGAEVSDACKEPGYFAPAVVRDDLTVTLRAVDSGTVVANGRSKVCYRRRMRAEPADPRASSQTASRFHGWQYYGDRLGVAVVRINQIDRPNFYKQQNVPSVVISGSNLRTGDKISIGTEAGGCIADPAAVNAGHLASISVIGATPQPTATVSALRPTVSNTNDNARFTVCWGNSGVGNGGHVPTVLRIQVRDLTPDLGVYYAFPSAVAVANNPDALSASTVIRVGGWNVREGDKLSLNAAHTNCRTVPDDAANRKAAAYERKDTYYDTVRATFPTGHVVNTQGTTGLGPVNDATPVPLRLCYFPVGLDSTLVPTSYAYDASPSATAGSSFPLANIVAVSAATCASGGDLTQGDPSLTGAARLLTNTFEGNVTAATPENAATNPRGTNPVSRTLLPRGTEVALFVAGCTRDGDKFGMINGAAGSGKACNVDNDVDIFATTGEFAVKTVADASWPRIEALPRTDAPTEVALCVHRGGSKVRFGGATTTYRTIGRSGQLNTIDTFLPPQAVTKPKWVTAGLEMPLDLELATSNTAQNEEYLLTAFAVSPLDACVHGALDVRDGTPPVDASPWFTRAQIRPLRLGSAMAFKLAADQDVTATRELYLCSRVNLGYPHGATPWVVQTGNLVLQHPKLRRMPSDAQPLATVGVDRTGLVTFGGVVPGDQVSFSETIGAEGECHASARSERQPIDQKLEAAYTRVDGEARQFANTTDGAANYACVTRAGDTRSYLLTTDPSTTITTRTTLTLGSFPTAVYALTKRDIPISSGVLFRGDSVGVATSALGCATSSNIRYATAEFDYGKSMKVAGFEFGLGSSPPAGGGKLCVKRFEALTPVEYAQSVRVARVESTYDGVSGTAINRALRVEKYVSFYLHGDTSVDVHFRGVNIGSEDQVAFALAGKCGEVPLGTHPKTTIDGQNRRISRDDTTGKFVPTDRGGTFELCYRACDDVGCSQPFDAWVGTSHTLIVVRLTASYPTGQIKTDKGSVFLTGEGIGAGDLAYFSVAGPCTSNRNSNPPPSSSPAIGVFDSVSRVVKARPGGSTSNVFELPFLVGDFSQQLAYQKVCYVPEHVRQHSTSAYAEFALPLQVQAKSTSPPPELSTDDFAGGQVRMFIGKPTVLRLVSGAAKVSLTEEYALRLTVKDNALAESADCGAATAGELTPDAPIVKDDSAAAGGVSGFTSTVTAGSTAAEYRICFRKTATASATGTADLVPIAGVTAVSVAAFGVSPLALVQGASGTHKVTLTGAVNVNALDTVCIVRAGAAAPVRCPTTPTTALSYAVTPGGGGGAYFTILDADISGKDGAWDVYLQPGGAANTASKTYPTAPVRITTDSGRIVTMSLKAVPSEVIAISTAAQSTADARVVYLGPSAVPNDRVFFSPTTSCTGATAGASLVDGDRKVLFTSGLATAGTYTACVRVSSLHASGATVADADFIRDVSTTLVVRDGPTVTLTTGSRRVQVGAPATLTVTGTVQPGDAFKVLTAGKSCVTQSSTVDDTMPTMGDPDAVVTGTVSLSWETAGTFAIRLPRGSVNSTHAVCYRPARPASAASTWVSLQGSPTFTAVRAFTPTLTPRATAAYAPTTFKMRVTNRLAGDLVGLTSVAGGGSCADAWQFETLATASAADEVSFTATLPPGTYRVCYAPVDTDRFRWYGNTLVGESEGSLRVVGLGSMSPPFASAEVNTTFSLRAARAGLSPGASVEAPFEQGDAFALVDAASGTCALPTPVPTFYRGVVNGSSISAGSGASPSAVMLADYAVPGLITGRTYRLCARLNGGPATGAVELVLRMPQSAGRVTAWRVPRVASVTPAALRPGVPQSLTVRGALLDGGDVVAVVARNGTAPAACAAMIPGNYSMRGASSNGMTTVSVAGPGPDGAVTLTKAGVHDLCYTHKQPNVTNPQGAAQHGVSVDVVDLVSIAPTGSYPTSGSGEVEVTFTGHFSTAAAADFVALLPTKDANGVAVSNCSSVNRLRDLRPVRLTSATTGVAKLNASHIADEYAVCFHFGGVSHGSPGYNTGGGGGGGGPAGASERSVAIGGSVPAGISSGVSSLTSLADRIGDIGTLPLELLTDPLHANALVFSVRLARNFSPMRIANGTSQVLGIRGTGVRAGDQVVLIPASDPANAASCIRAAGTISNVRVVEVSTRDATLKRGQVTVVAASAGRFRVCYRFSAPEVTADDWKIVSGDGVSFPTDDDARAGVLYAGAASVEQVRTVTIPAADASTAASFNAAGAKLDAAEAHLVVVQGAGINPGPAGGPSTAVAAGAWKFDQVRFVNATLVNASRSAAELDAQCASVVAGRSRASVWLPVSSLSASEWSGAVTLANPGGAATMGTLGAVTVRPGDLAAGPYVLCYRYTTSGHEGVRSLAKQAATQGITVYEKARVLGSYPRRIESRNGTSTAGGTRFPFTVVGQALTAADRIHLTADATCGTAFAQSVSVGNALPSPAGTTTLAATTTNLVAALTVSNAAKMTLCYYHGGEVSGLEIVADALAIGAECDTNTVTCPAGLPYRCGCECQATPCTTSAALTATCAPRLPGFVYCDASGVCARSPSMCPAVGDCKGAFRCPQGGCALSRDGCAPLPSCPPGMPRCLDGSCGTGGLCVNADGNNITEPLCSPGQTACDAGVCPALDGSCPKFNGCPPKRPVRCGACSCAASESACPYPAGVAQGKCTSSDFPIACSDGSCAASHAQCDCRRFEKFADQVLALRKAGARRSRPRRSRVSRATRASLGGGGGVGGRLGSSSLASLDLGLDAVVPADDDDDDAGTKRQVRRFARGVSATHMGVRRFELRANQAAEVWVSSDVVVYTPANFVAADDCFLEIAPLADSEILAATSAAGGTWQPVSAPVRLSYVTRGNVSHPRGPCPIATNTTTASVHWRTWDSPTLPYCSSLAVPVGIGATFNVTHDNSTAAQASQVVPGARQCHLRAEADVDGAFGLDAVSVLAVGQLPPPPPPPTPEPSPFPSLTPEPRPSRQPSTTPTPSVTPQVVSAATTRAPPAAAAIVSFATALLAVVLGAL